MGCDIHFYVEKNVGGVWQSADKWTTDKYAGEEGEPPVVLDYKDSFYHERNYELFAILAGVRNGRGFAGCDTGDGFVPISEPRGLPDDASEPVKVERWGEDGHSHSWLTVRELLEFDWTQTTKLRGWISSVTYWKWNRWDRERGESPAGWSGMVSGGGVTHVSEERMRELLEPYGKARQAADRIERELGGHYCQAEWEQPYYKCVRSFWSDTIPRLLRLGKPDDVRVVYWFDN